MTNKETLKKMANTDIEKIDINNLIDINDIKIDDKLSKEDKILSYLEQIKNPYIYKCGKTIIKVSFKDTNRTINEQFESYLNTL